MTYYDETKDNKVECGNCDWEGLESQMGKELFETPDLYERLDPGSEVPAGECPKCNCFCYLVKEEGGAPANAAQAGGEPPAAPNDADDEDTDAYLIFYRHDDCEEDPGVEWTDTHSCACNGECPACGMTDIEPVDFITTTQATEGAQAIDCLRALLEWNTNTGPWDNPVWDKAKHLMDKIRDRESAEADGKTAASQDAQEGP